MRALPRIEFGNYGPDLSPLGGPSPLAENALPRARGYGQLRDLQPYTSVPLADTCVGAVSAVNRSSGDTISTFAGDRTSLYKLVNNHEWEDRSQAPYVGVDYWRFATWKNNVYAVSGTVNPQVLEVTDLGNFADLTTTNLKAKHVAVWRYHLVVGDVTDDDGINKERVRWSAYEDASDWTISPSTLSDFQNLDGNRGDVKALVSGTTGLAFQEHGIWRAEWVGAPYAFRFDLVDEYVGTLTAGSVRRVGSAVYFLAQDGFRVISVSGAQPSQLIGQEEVIREFFEDLDLNYVDNVSSSVYEGEPVVVWSYPGKGNKGGVPNKLILFNYVTGKWATGIQDADLIFPWYQEPISIDSIDSWDQAAEGIDNVVYGSFDSRRYLGGGLAMGVFGTDHNLGLLSGPAKVARFETPEVEHHEGYRTHINGVRPIIERASGALKVQLVHRENLEDDIAVTGEKSLRSSGFASFRKKSRYFRYRVTVEGGFKNALGVRPYGRRAGTR